MTPLTPDSSLLTDDVARKAVFLDRDGTINVEKDYLYKIEDFEFIPGAPEAIKRLNDNGFLVIIVTNQAGVARGYYTLEDVDRLHEYVQSELAKYGASIDAFYICPHHPTEGVNDYRKECDCRKPEPGMLLQAAADFGIDLGRSYMIGDKISDVDVGNATGCIPLLVQTGYGWDALQEIGASSAVESFPTVANAVGSILKSV